MADAGRVIAGTAGGLRLRAPGAGTRPLADRVKQTLFGILDPDVAGARMLDLFAGSGAAGIEALSRGAAATTFVEKDARAAAVIADNLRTTGLAGAAATVVRSDAVRWLDEVARPGEPPYDLVFADPPYADADLLREVLNRLGAPNAPLAKEARVVAKHFWRDRPPERVGMLAVERERRFGETTLTFYRRQEADEER